MMLVTYNILLVFISTYINLIKSEIFPFLIHADQIFLKCPNGKYEILNNTTNIQSTCIQTPKLEQFNLFQLYIQCPDRHLQLEYNRTFTLNSPAPEYSIANLQPHCFIDDINPHQLVSPYQTRYTTENGTLTQIISFQCENNLTKITTEEFYLFFKLMNYGLCRYLIQSSYLHKKCNRINQQTTKIQIQIKHSICYYQLELHPPEISSDHFDQLIQTNHSFHSTKSVNHTIIIIITTSVAIGSLLICLIIFITMYCCGLFQI